VTTGLEARKISLGAYLFLVAVARKTPGLREAIWRLRVNFHVLQRHFLLAGRPIIDGGPLIEKAIANRQPFVAGKMGSLETLGLRTSLRRQKARQNGRKPFSYTAYLSHALYVVAGVYPQSEEVFDQFGNVYLETIKACDALAAWDVAGEAKIFRDHCAKTTLVKLLSLEPYFSAAPWSRSLKGKRVLVISPFVDSITKQYAKREELWDNLDILPLFKLLTLRAPMSAALVQPEMSDWFKSLDQLKAKMDAVDFDVALIGAGAFSLPLAVHAKNCGKVAIHLGGSLQILFGVVGKRWKENKTFKDFIKPSWCSPSSEETPKNFRIVEGGSYW
jgi:hypothetical protein